MIICSNCQQSNEEPATFCGFCGLKVVPEDRSNEPQSFVDITPDGQISMSANTAAEAKIALEELNRKKKELLRDKEQLTEQERQIQANYTAEVRNRESKLQGGESMGRFVRAFQTSDLDAVRRNLEQQLAPLEQQKRKIEAIEAAIEQLILEVESIILENS
jgi:hypothetical protein